MTTTKGGTNILAMTDDIDSLTTVTCCCSSTCQFIQQLTTHYNHSVPTTQPAVRRTMSSTDTDLSIHVTDWDDGHIPEGFKIIMSQQQHPQNPLVVQTSNEDNDDDSNPWVSSDDPNRTRINRNSMDRRCRFCCGDNGFVTRMVHYHRDYLHDHHDDDDDHNDGDAAIHVFDNAVPNLLLDALYEWTVSLDQPWGTYVTLDQVQRYWDDDHTNNHDERNHHHDQNELSQQDDLALQVVSFFCRAGLTSSHPTMVMTTRQQPSSSSSQPKIMFSANHTKNFPVDGNDSTVDQISSSSSSPPPVRNENDTTPSALVSWSSLRQEAHGVAIWALASSVGSQVPYHLDYAEQIRYDTNIICPPLYASTLHCTKLNQHHVTPNHHHDDNDDDEGNNYHTKQDEMHHHPDPSSLQNVSNDTDPRMRGGDFWVNLQGLDHYRKYGYKGALVTKTKVQQNSKQTVGSNHVQDEAMEEGNLHDNGDDNINNNVGLSDPACIKRQRNGDDDDDDDDGWVCIPYSYNRMICHKGDLPHCSTKVEVLPPNRKRVVVGFNVFPRIVGDRVQQAPEHSNAFRRKVQLQRLWLRQQLKLHQSPSSTTTTTTTTMKTPTTTSSTWTCDGGSNQLTGLPTECNCNNNTSLRAIDTSTVTEQSASSSLSSKTVESNPLKSSNGITLNMIQSNKSLTKLFVLAKRHRIQDEFRQARMKLRHDIIQIVWQRQQQQASAVETRQSPSHRQVPLDQLSTIPNTCVSSTIPTTTCTAVAYLMKQLGTKKVGVNCVSENESILRGWPTPIDVQVQVHHMLLEAGCTITATKDNDSAMRQLRLMQVKSITKNDKADQMDGMQVVVVEPNENNNNGLISPDTLVFVERIS